MLNKVLMGLGILWMVQTVGGYAASAITSAIDYTIGRARFVFNPNNYTQGTLTIPVTVTNSSPVGLPISYFNGFLFWGTERLGNIYLPAPVTVPANGSVTFDLSITTNLNVVVGAGININTTGQWFSGLSIKANVRVGTFTIPIDQPIQIL